MAVADSQVSSLLQQTPSSAYGPDQLSIWGLTPSRIPRHVAIIMDGNGRWAAQHQLPRIEGHRRGVSTVRAIIEEASRLGVQHLTLYCFSSENWKRPEQEQRLLMQLLVQYLVEERQEILRQQLRFRMIGRRDRLSDEVLHELDKTRDLTVNHQGMELCLAINYGSRAEIRDAVQRLAQDVARGVLAPEDITEEDLNQKLDTSGMPDPDLVIRTAGEMRLSNFLLWQISYSELWVTSRFWPEFTPEDLRSALRDFAGRQRRFGGLNS